MIISYGYDIYFHPYETYFHQNIFPAFRIGKIFSPSQNQQVRPRKDALLISLILVLHQFVVIYVEIAIGLLIHRLKNVVHAVQVHPVNELIAAL